MGIKDVASALEKETKTCIEAVADQLHQMTAAERMAVVRQIQADERCQRGLSLPALSFAADGELKSYFLKGSSETVSEDFENGKLKSRDLRESDGCESHAEYDPKSGALKYLTNSQPVRGITERWELDPTAQTVRLRPVDINSARERIHMEYDSSSGQLKSEVITNLHGGSRRREFDPETGALKSVTWMQAGRRIGHEEYVYDAESRHLIFRHLTNGSGSVLFRYDRRTGRLKSADYIYPNGSTEHDDYDAKTGALKSEASRR